MPLGAIDMICKLVIMNLSDYYGDRTLFGSLAMCLPFAGGLIMLLAPQTNKGVLLFGYSLIGAAGTGWGLTMASLSGNTVGYTKKATANAVQIIGQYSILKLVCLVDADGSIWYRKLDWSSNLPSCYRASLSYWQNRSCEFLRSLNCDSARLAVRQLEGEQTER